MGRTRRVGASVAAGVVAVAVLVLSATGVLAQEEYPPPEDFDVVCLPSSPAAGVDIDCEVVGAQPGEQLRATAVLTNSPVVSAPADGQAAIVLVQATSGASVSLLDTQLTADAAGRTAFGFSVPGDAAYGSTIDVVVDGDESGRASTQLTVSNVTEVEGEVITRDDVDDSGSTEDGLAAGAEVEGRVLALTGTQLVALVVLGSVLLVAGMLLVRRRRVTKVAS